MRYPLDQMRIREHQGGRYAPVTNTFGLVRTQNTRPHQGWDLEAAPGTPVYAITNGEASVSTGTGDYGNTINLKFSFRGRTYYAFYAHLIPHLSASRSVNEGCLLGHTGMTGNASRLPEAEAHLHFEIRTIANPGRGLNGRVDPGEIFGYEIYSSTPT